MIKRLIAAVTAAAMLLLTACSSSTVVLPKTEQTVITLSWWGNDSRNEYTLAAVKKFEQMHPGIKVKCSYSEWSGYESRSRVQMISGTEADVMQINVGWLPQYSFDGKGYYDIEQLAGTVDLSSFSGQLLEYGRRNGILNAIPIAMNAETVYINRGIYSSHGLDIPKTWDDFFEAAKVLSKDGIYALSGAEKSIWLMLIAYAEQKSGKKIFNEKSQLCFGEEEFRMMIELYCRLVNENVMPKVEDFKRYNIDNQVYAGVVAWVSDALNYFKGPMDKGMDIIPVDYPAFSPENSGEGWYAKPATLYAVSKNTEHPTEAAMLLEFMLNSDEWADLQGVEKGIPVSTKVREHLESTGVLKGIQYDASQIMEKNTRISAMDSKIENSDMFGNFTSSCDQVLFGKASLEQAAADYYSLISQLYRVAES